MRGVVLAAAFLAGCAYNPVTGLPDFVLFSEEQEIEAGAQFHEDVLGQYPLYRDPELAAYVDEVGQRLGANSHRDHLVWHFFVLDSPEVNAFALPGGFVYVTRGLLAHLRTEDQLAGVLGHEIGHVSARHGVRQYSRGIVVGLIGSAAASATGSGTIGDMSNVLGTVLLNGYGRRHELEADRLGARYLAASGYDPAAMSDVIATLGAQELFEIRHARDEGRRPSAYHGLLATHPGAERRLRAVAAAAGESLPEPFRPNDDPYLERIDGLVYGHARQQGMLRDGRFLHVDLDLHVALPEGWQSENRPSRLLSVAPGRDAIIQLVLDDAGGHRSPAAYLEAEFPGGGEIRPFRVGDLAAAETTAVLETPFGRRESRVAAVFHGRVLVFAVVADGSRALPEFDAVVGSVRTLDAEEREVAAERVIRVVRARPGEDYAALARSWAGTIDELRLVNGHYPDREPIPGQPLKVLERSGPSSAGASKDGREVDDRLAMTNRCPVCSNSAPQHQ